MEHYHIQKLDRNNKLVGTTQTDTNWQKQYKITKIEQKNHFKNKLKKDLA